MPPNPLHTSSIAVHSLVPFTGAVLDELQGEDFLLVRECIRRGTSERLTEVDADGNLVLDIEFHQTLLYSIAADVLLFDGLANYHPGRALDDRLLAFANGRPAFQFRSGGKLIYRDPVHTLRAGDLPALDFQIENIFIDLDTDTYPTTSVVLTSDLPVVASAPVSAAALRALLEMVFWGGASFTAAVAGTLTDATPVDVSTPKLTAAWTSLSEPVTASTTLCTAPAVTWSGTSGPRTVASIRFDRDTLTLSTIPLASPISLNPWTSLVAGAADLSVTLHWPFDGTAPTAADRPARHGLTHLMGGNDPILSDTAATTLTLRAWDADPAAGGTELDNFTIPREALLGLSLPADDTVAQNNILNGSNLAPGGDWQVEYLTVEVTGHTGVWFIKRAWSQLFTSGNIISIPAHTLDLTIG